MKYDELVDWLKADGYLVAPIEGVKRPKGGVFVNLEVYNDYVGQSAFLSVITDKNENAHVNNGGRWITDYAKVSQLVHNVTSEDR